MNDFIPPAADGLPPGALDSATDGANRLDAYALTGEGRNLLAHALVQLARDGWLRTDPGPGFETARDDVEQPEPRDPSLTGPAPTATDEMNEIQIAVDRLRTAKFTGAVTATLVVAALVAARKPIAALLDGLKSTGMSDPKFSHALAVARAINGRKGGQ